MDVVVKLHEWWRLWSEKCLVEVRFFFCSSNNGLICAWTRTLWMLLELREKNVCCPIDQFFCDQLSLRCKKTSLLLLCVTWRSISAAAAVVLSAVSGAVHLYACRGKGPECTAAWRLHPQFCMSFWKAKICLNETCTLFSATGIVASRSRKLTCFM